MNDDLYWLDRINSPELSIRFEAFEETIDTFRRELTAYFRRRFDFPEVAHALSHQVLAQMGEVVQKKSVHFSDFTHFTRYVWATAKSRAIDYIREGNRERRLLDIEEFHEEVDNVRSIEDSLLEEWSRRRFLSILPTLPNEEAQLTTTLALTGYDPRHISMLLSWSEKTARRHLDDAAKSLRFRFSAEPEFIFKPNRWDYLLYFEDGGGALGLTYTAAQPREFAPETAELLCRELGLTNIEQLPRAYRAHLIVQNVYTDTPTVRLAFTERNSMSLRTLRGEPLYYLDGIPLFYDPDQVWDGKNSLKRNKANERLGLVDIKTYRANVIDPVRNEELGVDYLDWAYDFDGKKLRVRKLYEPEHFTGSQNMKGSVLYFRVREMD